MSGINSKVFQFFSTLAQNNNREWFESRKPEFKALESEVKIFVKEIESGLQQHDKIQKAKIFRIYRDVRFSKNKTPYKTHFGISFHRKKPNLRGGYYLHIAPQNSFIATGFWNPDPKDLLRIRKELELDGDELLKIINKNNFKNIWGEIQGDSVKTSPRGFSSDHPSIDLIRRKQYIFIKKFDDKSVLSPEFQNQVIKNFKAIRPFFDYMTNVLTTDLNGVSLL